MERERERERESEKEGNECSNESSGAIKERQRGKDWHFHAYQEGKGLQLPTKQASSPKVTLHEHQFQLRLIALWAGRLATTLETTFTLWTLPHCMPDSMSDFEKWGIRERRGHSLECSVGKQPYKSQSVS